MKDEMMQYQLDGKAKVYIEEHLAAGGMLSEIMIHRLNLNLGDVYTILPRDAHIKQIDRYKAGGILNDAGLPKGQSWEQVPNLDEYFSKFIFDYLSSSDDSYCLIEDVLAYSSDKNIEINGSSLLVHNKSITYFLGATSELEVVLNVVKQCKTAWHFVGILARGDVFNIVKNTTIQISDNQLKTLCRNIQVLLLGAYDGEGYLCWERKKNSELEK
ncbi:MAG: hypothetical protein ABIH77_02160 [Pseudomonadota bacterium]|nr:hypothetical protein [Gammaproteobacteria bacterium]MBU1559181.1 hypothetical protein [Gammaproteobacteria bacterium]MBU1629287.1 hypothetical protein [Gammaproteobacteria bacterium]MBU2546037.1 hypothetical protein [Gammaproteobacteria bacterium]